MYKRLYYHLTSNNILVKELFGFRCSNLTEIFIYTLINNVLSSLNNKILISALSCGLQKAFDCVNYDILLSKMKFCGISGVANKLRNRYQRVVINARSNSNGYFSKWEEVQHGGPQGSLLVPLLLLIYVNDLSKSLSDKTSPILFADDTSFIIANHNETEFKFNTNEIFSEINNWLHGNLLS